MSIFMVGSVGIISLITLAYMWDFNNYLIPSKERVK